MVEQLKRELEEDHGSRNRRIQAAKERAARERVERITAARQPQFHGESEWSTTVTGQKGQADPTPRRSIAWG